MKIMEEIKNENFTIYRIYLNDINIGSMEVIQEKDHIFLENIFIDIAYRGKHLLKRCLDFFNQTIVCLPLPQHVEKFKHLGFKMYKQDELDTYYIR